jgi:hypothetical protein
MGYCYVCGVAPHLNAGSAIPPGSAMPTYPLNAFLIADPFGSDPHIYAEDDARTQSYIANGDYEFLPECSVDGCNNRQVPGELFCGKHMNPPIAKDT